MWTSTNETSNPTRFIGNRHCESLSLQPHAFILGHNQRLGWTDGVGTCKPTLTHMFNLNEVKQKSGSENRLRHLKSHQLLKNMNEFFFCVNHLPTSPISLSSTFLDCVRKPENTWWMNHFITTTQSLFNPCISSSATQPSFIPTSSNIDALVFQVCRMWKLCEGVLLWRYLKTFSFKRRSVRLVLMSHLSVPHTLLYHQHRVMVLPRKQWHNCIFSFI